jgi:hypothetical protein
MVWTLIELLRPKDKQRLKKQRKMQKPNVDSTSNQNKNHSNWIYLDDVTVFMVTIESSSATITSSTPPRM